LGQGTDGLAIILLEITDPGEAITADLHDDAAHLLQEQYLVRGPNHGAIPRAKGLEGAVDPLEFRGHGIEGSGQLLQFPSAILQTGAGTQIALVFTIAWAMGGGALLLSELIALELFNLIAVGGPALASAIVALVFLAREHRIEKLEAKATGPQSSVPTEGE